MNVGDRMSVPFGKGMKEGTVVRVFDKSVWLKVDFPRHPGKLLRRKVSQVQALGAKPAKKKRGASKRTAKAAG